MSVSAESRMVSAISLGVFWRFAPSTSEIMRSRNPSPGLMETRILISSESTRVPPVTALRSPPLSRMTGADSPVMADSSTVAAPSMTSPSAGMISPARTTTTSPLRRSLALTSSTWPLLARRWAIVFTRVPRSALAWALPRPSATASAKFAKRTVNQSQMASWAMKLRSVWAVKIPTVVSTAPTMVTNMTGFLTIRRGSSFLKASPTAGPAMFQSKRDGALWVIKKWRVTGGGWRVTWD